MLAFPGCDQLQAIWLHGMHCLVRGVTLRISNSELAAPCAQIIEDAAVHEQYSRVITPEPAMNEETEDVCALLQQCLDLRRACCHALPACHTQTPRGASRMACACVQCGSVRSRPGLYLWRPSMWSFLEAQQQDEGLQLGWAVQRCAHTGKSACTGLHWPALSPVAMGQAKEVARLSQPEATPFKMIANGASMSIATIRGSIV